MGDENIVEYRKSLRWYVIGTILFVFFIVIGFLSENYFDFSISFLLVLVICSGIPRFISNRIYLNDLSIRLVRGLINTTEEDIPYSKIDGIRISWVWAGGGNIILSSGGTDYIFRSMGNIEDLQQKLNKRIEDALVNAKATIVANSNEISAVNQTSDVDELEKLSALKQEGSLTDDEYSAMKQKIISR